LVFLSPRCWDCTSNKPQLIPSEWKPQDLKVEEKVFKGMSRFKYLGNMINNDNRNDNYIKERIQTGNKAYFANLITPKSKIISKAAKNFF
jgi:hypothetical protein